MRRSITVATPINVPLASLIEFLINAGGFYVSDDGLGYIRSEDAALMVYVSSNRINPFYAADEMEVLTICIGSPPLGEIEIGYETHKSKALANTVAARMISVWGGCVVEDILDQD